MKIYQLTTYSMLNAILNNIYKYNIEIYNKYNIVIMFENCYRFIFDSHALLFKIFKIFVSGLKAGLSGPPVSN